jgi:hypothetical protein
MTKEASMDLLANMYVSNGEARDKAAVAQEYGRLSGGYGSVDVAHNAINSQAQYIKDQNVIKDMLMKTTTLDGRTQNAVTALINNPTPERVAQFDEYAKKYYGVNNLSRYFVGN